MKFPNNEENRAASQHLSSANEVSSTAIVLHLIKLLAKGSL